VDHNCNGIIDEGCVTSILRPLPGNNDGTDDGSGNAGKDSWTRGSPMNDINYGSDDKMIASEMPTGGNCHAVIQFDLDELPDDVESAIIRLYSFDLKVR